MRGDYCGFVYVSRANLVRNLIDWHVVFIAINVDAHAINCG